MSKSLKRVKAALEEFGLSTEIKDAPNTKTALEAAQSVGCALDQIAKSIIFARSDTGLPVLFITAGGNKVDPSKASALVGVELGRADASLIRSHTGFAIGGVSPIGHLGPIDAFFDPKLLEFSEIYAAAGTPNHLFGVDPRVLQKIIDAKVSDFIQ
ncbi:MAG: YbaK/EbsC family protein [Pseudomonadota bacterium]